MTNHPYTLPAPRRALCLLAIACLLCTLLPATVALAEDDAYIKITTAGDLWKGGYSDSDPATQVSLGATAVGTVYRTSTSGYSGWYKVLLVDGTDAWIKAAEVTAISGEAVIPNGITKLKTTANANVVNSAKDVLGTAASGTVLTIVNVYNGSDASDRWYQVTDGTISGYIKYDEATTLNLYEQTTATVGTIAAASPTATSTTASPSVTGTPTDAGAKSALIVPSATKTYVQLTGDVSLFTGETSGGTTVTAPKGSYLQMVADQTYTVSGVKYACLYYNSTRYNVKYDDISGMRQTEAATLTYITGTLWKQTSFTSLKSELKLIGDVRVHGLQLALKTLGFYSGTLDGTFGSGTMEAVKAFQKAHKLEVDGRAGPATQSVLYPLALAAYGTGTGTGTTTPTTTTGTLVTSVSVNMRKSTSKSSTRYGTIAAKVTLAYSATSVVDGVTWYKVQYTFGTKTRTGWLMGTYVSVSSTSTGTGTGTGTTTGTVIGTVTILKKNTRVRKTPGGAKTGYTLGVGATVSLMASPTTSGGYTWYYIKMANGVLGYVRGDCASANISGSSGSSGGSTTTTTDFPSIAVLTADTAVTLDADPTKTGAIPANAAILVTTPTAVTVDGADVYKAYYNGLLYRIPSASMTGLKTMEASREYIINTIWGTTHSSVSAKYKQVGNLYCLSVQYALKTMGYYSGALDGTVANATTAAIMNFQSANALTADGSCGPLTQAKLYLQAKAALSGGSTAASGSFGTFTSIVTGSAWSTVKNSTTIFPANSTATVLDIRTGYVFTIYRWSGSAHADCVPYTAADTKTMCDIVGFAYNSSKPSSSQLASIKSHGDYNDTGSGLKYTWPDFLGAWGTAMSLTSAWDHRPVLINCRGTVYVGSIYGMPHGFTGSNSFSTSKYTSGTYAGNYFYNVNNMYGMICVHFNGSTNHSGNTVNTAAVAEAIKYAKSVYPALVK